MPITGFGPLTGAVASFDRAVDRRLEPLRANPTANRVLYAASEAGNFSVLWHVLAWAPVVVAPTPRRIARAARVSVALGVESAVVNGPIKSMFRRERPTAPAGGRPHRLRTPKTSSFPSGHATAAMVAAAMLGRRSRLSPLYHLAGIVVATSRVHVRIHHASDVVGGLAIGVVLGRVARRLLR